MKLAFREYLNKMFIYNSSRAHSLCVQSLPFTGITLLQQYYELIRLNASAIVAWYPFAPASH